MLCVIAALGASTYLVMSQALESSQRQNLEYLVQEVGKNLNTAIDNRKDLIARIAGSEDVARYISKQQDTLLIGQFNKYISRFPIISYANINGVEQLKLVNGRVSQDMRSLSDTSLFIDAARHPNTPVCVYLPSEPGIQGPCLAFGIYGMSFFDEFTGFFRAVVQVSAVASDLKNMRIGEKGFILLVDSEGRILSCPEEYSTADKLDTGQTGDADAYERLCAMEGGYGRGNMMGIDSYFVYAPIRQIDWSVVAVVPRSEFAARLSTLRNTVILIGFVVLIASVLVMMAVADNIARPILTLTKTTGLIAQGDFSQRVEIMSKDEIGTLADSFNRMSAELEITTTSVSRLNSEVSERRKAEEALMRLNTELEAAVARLTAANRELEEFAHITAHDLKTPLRAIGSLAGMIQSDYWDKLDTQGRNYLSLLMGRVERMNQFIRGILKYSEMGRVMERQMVDVNEVLDEVLGGIPLPANCMVIKESPFPVISCNRAQITEVFSQLISNAVRYMDKPSGR